MCLKVAQKFLGEFFLTKRDLSEPNSHASFLLSVSNCKSFQLSRIVKLFLYLTTIIEKISKIIAPNRYTTMKVHLIKNLMILI